MVLISYAGYFLLIHNGFQRFYKTIANCLQPGMKVTQLSMALCLEQLLLLSSFPWSG